MLNQANHGGGHQPPLDGGGGPFSAPALPFAVAFWHPVVSDVDGASQHTAGQPAGPDSGACEQRAAGDEPCRGTWRNLTAASTGTTRQGTEHSRAAVTTAAPGALRVPSVVEVPTAHERLPPEVHTGAVKPVEGAGEPGGRFSPLSAAANTREGPPVNTPPQSVDGARWSPKLVTIEFEILSGVDRKLVGSGQHRYVSESGGSYGISITQQRPSHRTTWPGRSMATRGFRASHPPGAEPGSLRGTREPARAPDDTERRLKSRWRCLARHVVAACLMAYWTVRVCSTSSCACPRWRAAAPCG